MPAHSGALVRLRPTNQPAKADMLDQTERHLEPGTWGTLRAGGRAGVLCLAVVATAAITPPASAELKVRMPTVEQGELELEHNGLVTLGRTSNPLNRAQSYTNELEYGVTSWWKFGI